MIAQLLFTTDVNTSVVARLPVHTSIGLTTHPVEGSPICKRFLSTEEFLNAYTKRREVPKTVVQNVCSSRNVRRRLTTGQPSLSANLSSLPTSAEQHLHTTDILRNRRMTDTNDTVTLRPTKVETTITVRILQKSQEKSQKPDKNGHENGKSTQEPGIIKIWSTKVNIGQPRTPNVVETELRTIVEVAPMADNRTMEELLQVPTKGACPHHGFTELAQIDTFYNGLNDNDQDSLNVAAGGNLLSKTTREALNIIENKSKVRYSKNKPNVSRMNTNSRENASKMDDRIDKLADQISTLVDIFAKKIVTPAPVKAIEESCVTCGGPHAHYNCDATNNNQPSVCVATGEFKNEIQNTMKTQQTVLMEQQNDFQNNLQNMLSGFFQNQSSTLGTLSSNTIPNPKGEMKAITTCSGVVYKGPLIPTPTKDKLFELAKIPLNENCSAMLLKELPENLGDPDKFLIPWRSFLRIGRALIDVYGEEITIRVNDKAVTFNLKQTTRYSSTYDDLSVNQIDIIDVSREDTMMTCHPPIRPAATCTVPRIQMISRQPPPR
nr:reverse transcriptase domain-containing protein [Tanacetum cinerariifolium]